MPKPICNCSYPKPKWRNGTGHAETCPIQIAWNKKLKEKESKTK